ncbi:MAG: amino acid adenylation domain-containing protein [Scytolyngbya sp. HA4215-MV1]|jgi:amino acid adenylation domain-containing protein/thioester reductase-like protein|nr:amino acid adenylation domain-containing protein [Scytolyngbya sp. HA4215-MV1]
MLSDISEFSIHRLIEIQVSQTPDAIAVMAEGKSLTYRALNQRANQLAHYLKTLGVMPEVLVGICLERSLEMVITLLAILKAGGAYVPLDPSYPRERLAFMMADAQISVLITQASLLTVLPPHQAKVVGWEEASSQIAQQSEIDCSSGVRPEHLAYVIYTSGSTGKPKGVAIEHRNTVAFIDWARKFFSREQLAGVLASTSICFDLSVFELFVTFSVGGTVILAENALQLPRLSAANQVTLINTVPSAIAELLRMDGIPDSVHTINLAGEPLQNLLVQQLYQKESIQQVFNLYGPSEDTTYSTVALVPKGADTPPAIGYAISNTQIYLLDEQHQPVAADQPGEIYIGGAGLARGYLHRPELTAERFIANPFSDQPGSRLYKTGDLATFLPDGRLKYLGRLDHQVKIRGFRVELGEIEAVLYQHPWVQQAIVVDREVRPGDKRLVAYIVAEQQGQNATDSDWQRRLAMQGVRQQVHQTLIKTLRQSLKQQLPDFMVPSHFVLLETLPLTLNGKVDRQALPAPDWNPYELDRPFIAPSTPIEKQLAGVWQQLLGVCHIGLHDNFFELGGHSLLAVELVEQVEVEFQVEVPLVCFLEMPTLAGLAATIAAHLATTAQSVTVTHSPLKNLSSDTVLDPTIQPEKSPHLPIVQPQNIFLTGATGFLGAFLLDELLQQTTAKIYCLVRSTHEAAGKQRIQANLVAYSLWRECYSDRIIPILGDLSEPLLGIAAERFLHLAQEIDVIYHNGALVNFLYPYSALRTANVLGTQEVLRLASHTRRKPVHFTSTVDVFASLDVPQSQQFNETDRVELGEQLMSGYAQSKWVAEKLVMAAAAKGLPVSIYRPSYITGHSQRGVWNTQDLVCRLLKGCIQMASAPDLEISLNLVPIDYVSQSLVYLSQQPAAIGQAFHLVNPKPLSWQQLTRFINALGYPVRQVPYDQWHDCLLKVAADPQHPLHPLLTCFASQSATESEIGTHQFGCEQTVHQLNAAIPCPEITLSLMKTYLQYFIQSGFLKVQSLTVC